MGGQRATVHLVVVVMLMSSAGAHKSVKHMKPGVSARSDHHPWSNSQCTFTLMKEDGVKHPAVYRDNQWLIYLCSSFFHPSPTSSKLDKTTMYTRTTAAH